MDEPVIHPGADVDVEALLARIREGASAAVASAPRHAALPAADEPERLEIDRALHAQAELNGALVRSLGALAQHLEAVERRAAALERQLPGRGEPGLAVSPRQRERADPLAAALADLRATVVALATRATSLEDRLTRDASEQRERTEARLAALERQLQARTQQTLMAADRRDVLRDELQSLQQSLATSLAAQETRLRTRLAQHARTLRDTTERLGQLTATLEAARPPARAPAPADADSPFDAMRFAETFRGSVAEIKRRQAAYLDLFVGRAGVLDLGCGRGELLELLAEHGIPARGIDSNDAMIRSCRARGLPVVQADMFAYLRDLPNGTLDCVTAFQLLEHLSPALLFELLALCGQKLRPGGLIVCETQNPACPPVLGKFYIDPTHVRPIPAELLRFAFAQEPYSVQCVRFSSPLAPCGAAPVLDVTGELPDTARRYQDYAVVAARR